MPDAPADPPLDPNAPRYGERPPYAPPFVAAVGQPRYGQPGVYPKGHSDYAFRDVTWRGVITVIIIAVLVMAGIIWYAVR